MGAALDSLLEYDRAALVELLGSLGHKAFRATQVMEWVWRHRVADFSAMTNLYCVIIILQSLNQWMG